MSTREERHERFLAVVARARARAEAESAAHLQRIRDLPKPEPDDARGEAHQRFRERVFGRRRR